jgi:hypothetical protein
MKYSICLLLAGAVLADCDRALAQDAADVSTGVAPDPALIERSAPPAADTSYRTAARGGIIAGTVLEATGLAGMLAGSMTALFLGSGKDASMTATIVSGGLLSVGGLVSAVAHGERHKAYRRAGIETRRNMAAFGWLFTLGTIAWWVGSTSWFADAIENGWETDSYNSWTAGILCAAGAMAFDVLNLSVFRTLWRRDMRLAEEKRDFAVALSPLVIPSGVGSSGSTAAGLAVTGSF